LRLTGRNGWLYWGMALTRLLLFFLLVGQNGLQHVARLGNIRQVDFGRNTLMGTGVRRASAAA
jgi:hypothetical protein